MADPSQPDRLDYANPGPTASADRAAARSVRIGVYTLLGGALILAIFMIRKRLGAHNGILPILVPMAMLIGHSLGTIEALRALRGECVRHRTAKIGLTINATMVGAILLLLALIVVLVGAWASIGR